MRYFSELTNKSLDIQIYVVGSRVQTLTKISAIEDSFGLLSTKIPWAVFQIIF